MPHVTPLHADDPRRVGRYRLTGRIAGMPGAGPVYLARTVDGGEVTITLLDGDWTADPAERDRFAAEANAASPGRAVLRGADPGGGIRRRARRSWSASTSPGPRCRSSSPRKVRGRAATSRRWPSGPRPGWPRSTRPGWCTATSGPSMSCSSADGPAGDRVRHHPALRLGHPRPRHARLGPHGAVSRRPARPRTPPIPDLALLPEPLRDARRPVPVRRTRRPARRPVGRARRFSATTTRPPGCSAEGARRRGARRRAAAGRRTAAPRTAPRQGRTRRAVAALVGGRRSPSASLAIVAGASTSLQNAEQPAQPGAAQPPASDRPSRRLDEPSPARRRTAHGGHGPGRPGRAPGRARSARPARPTRSSVTVT